jgi:hypothetical protein
MQRRSRLVTVVVSGIATAVALLASGCSVGGAAPAVETLPASSSAPAVAPSDSTSASSPTAGSTSSQAGPTAPPSGAATATGSVDSMSATDIVASARQAVKQHSSVHVSGTGSSDGNPLHIDLKLVRAGASAAVLEEPGVRKVEVVGLGRDVWVRSDHSFWVETASAAVADRVGTHWGRLARSGETPLRQFVDYDTFMSGLLVTAGALSRVPGVTIAGVSTVGVRDGGGVGGVLYVRADADPVPLRIDQQGQLDLDHWDESFTVATPDPADVVDLS